MKALVIDSSALRANIQEIKRKADSTEVIADLSCDGQGLGLVALAGILRDEGIYSFAVSTTDDAIQLRGAGFSDERILMLHSTVDTDELQTLVDHNIVCTVGSYDAGIALNSIAENRSITAEIKVRIDTGLGSYGFLPAETDKIVNLFRHMPGLLIVGMYTCLSASWKNRKLTTEQLANFSAVIDWLHDQGYETGPVHALDSAALFKYDFDKMDAVCVGSAIIGAIPGRARYNLVRIGHIEADIEQINWVMKGQKIGFGASHSLKSNSKLGVVPVGWSNGIGACANVTEASRSVVNRVKNVFIANDVPPVRVNGGKAKVLGPVGMTSLILDLTHVNCATGDKAVIEADPRLVTGLPLVFY